MQNEPVVISPTFQAPVDRVWEAITDKDQMRKWYFDIKEFAPQVGFTFEFYAGEEGKQYLHICKVMEADPGKKLAYTWRFGGIEGLSLVTFELSPEGEQTTLKLTHSGLESFPADNPAMAKENFQQGWEWIIGTSLKEFVEKSDPNAASGI
jgi:uncharacterized protein YndB with AHSA1/START domain